MGKDAVVSLKPIGLAGTADQGRDEYESREDRCNQCMEEINKVLDKFGMTIEIINDVRVVPQD